MIKNPYRYFFIIGIFSALLGVGIWPLSFLGINLVSEILLFHKVLLFGGFILSFANGFLLTAYPNFTSTKRVTLWEWNFIFIGQLIVPAGALADNLKFSILGVFICILGMGIFFISRFGQKKTIPPASFRFVWLAFVFLMASVYLIYKSSMGETITDELLNNFLFYGVVLNLIFGIGLKIFPAFFGHGKNIFEIEKKELNYFKKNSITIELIILNSLFILDLFGQFKIANILRSLVVLFILFYQLKINAIPRISFLTRGIWFALCFIPLGIFLRVFDQFKIFGIHLYFICGFSLITLLVAGRVTAAHGGFNLDIERKDKRILLLILLSLLAGAFRFLPAIFTQFNLIYFYYISYVFWFLYFVCWLFIYFKKLIFPNQEV